MPFLCSLQMYRTFLLATESESESKVHHMFAVGLGSLAKDESERTPSSRLSFA